jgi:hypothetical protein
MLLRNLPLCVRCGRSFDRCTPWQRYCSARCRVADFRAAGALQATDGPEPQKEKINTVRASANFDVAKNRVGSTAAVTHQTEGRSPISGPRHVIECELFDGLHWRKVTSPDGVVVLVSRLGGRR